MPQYIWNYFAHFVGTILPPLLTLFLARILEPSDFGQFAIYMSVLGLLQSLVFGAMGEIILKSDNSNVMDHIFSLQFALIIVICPIIVAFSVYNPWGIGDWKVILTLGLLLCLISFVDTSIKFSMREQNFKKVFFRRLISPLGNAVVSIPMALTGFGFWSLVMGQLCGYILVGLYIRGTSVYPRFNFMLVNLKNELPFGINMYVQSSVKWIRSKADRMALGLSRSSKDVGTYDLVRLLSSLPFTSIVEPISQVLYSKTVQLKDEVQVTKFYNSAQRRILLISTPLFLFLELNSELFVRTLLGENYVGSVSLFRVFLISGLLSTVVGTNMEYFKAVSKPSVMTKFMIIRAIFTIPVLLFYAPLGLTELAISLLCLSIIFVPINVALTQLTMDSSVSSYYRNVLSLPLNTFIIQVAICMLTYLVLTDEVIIAIVSLIMLGCSTLAVFILYEKTLVNDLLSMLKERR